MSNGGTNGLLTALAMVGAAGRVEGSDDAEQAEMFAADDAMPSMIPKAAESATRSGPRGGRPRGARNKSTEAYRELFLSKFRHPLMVLGELTSMAPAELARSLGLYMYAEGKPVLSRKYGPDGEFIGFEYALATGEAAKIQKDAAIALLPYLGQKLPMAIEVTKPERGVVVIGNLDRFSGAQSDLTVPFAHDDQPQQNQQVIEATAVRLDDAQSDEMPKPQNSLTDFKDDL